MANKKVKYWASLVLVLTFVIGLASPAVVTNAKAAAGLTDISEHWAKDKITQWVEKGFVSGYTDGTFKPDKSITRAEFMILVNKAFDFSEKAAIGFSDATVADWFYDEVAKAVKAGYISGYQDGTVKPNREISRQEAAVALCKALNLKTRDDAVEFTDTDTIPIWSRQYIGVLVSEGYMSGYPDGSFKAERPITRAETITMLDKAFQAPQLSYNEAGTYGPKEGTETVSQDVAINVPGVTLRNMVIDGDLYLNEGIGEGDITLDNVTVKGTTTVRGGGKDSIHLVNFTGEEIIVIKVGGKVRIVASGDTKVDELELKSGAHIEGKGFEIITVLKAGEEIILDGDFEEVIIDADAKVKVLEGTTIGKMKINDKAKVDLAEGSTVEDMTVDDAAEITGKGTIEKAKINADGAKLEPKPKEYDLAKDITAEIAGKEVKGEEKKSSGGGGGGGSSEVKVTGISVSPSTVTLAVYEAVYQKSVTLTATITPADADNKKVTWTSNDDKVATVKGDGLKVTVEAVSKGTATITVTADDGGYTDACKVTVKGKVEPEPTTYTLTLSGEGLTSTPDAGDIAENTEVTIIVTAPEGKQVATFTVGGVDTKAELVGGKFTFDITKDTEVVVTYEDIPTPLLQSIEITTPPTKTNYTVGEELDLTGLVVTGTYRDDSKKIIEITKDMISGFDSSKAAVDQVVTITVEGKTATFEVTIEENPEPITVKSVNVVDGADGHTPVTIPRVGQVIRANITLSDGTEIGTYPVNENAVYKWYYKESTDTVLGTEGSYTVTSDNIGNTICVEVTVKGYEGTATWTATDAVPAPALEANFESTGNIGIAPETAGEAAGKIYAEYKLVANGKDISLTIDNIGEEGYIKVKVGEDGKLEELTPNTDTTLWFNVEAEKGVRNYEIKTTDGKVYTATLDWKEEIKTATWKSTEREGEHDGKTYVEYELLDGEKPVSLKIGEVKLIASKDSEGKWVELEPNTDTTLWFKKDKETGSYEYFVVANRNAMYKAKLDWKNPGEEPEKTPMSVSYKANEFTVGEKQEFTVTTVANDDEGKMIRAHFEIPANISVEYYEVNDGQWYALGNVYGPETGFPVADATSKFRAVASVAGTCTVKVTFKEVGTDKVLAEKDIVIEAKDAAVPVELIAAEVDYAAVWNESRGTWYVKVTVPENNLDAASVKSISTIKKAGEELTEPVVLTPDIDKVMWFSVAKADGERTFKAPGEYAYKVVRQDNSEFTFNFTYNPESVTGVTNLVEAALAAVNNAGAFVSDDNHPMRDAIEANAIILGLATGEDTTYYGLLDGRKRAANIDLYDNKPVDGYDIKTLQITFDEIVATRLVFEQSVVKFAAASAEQPLENLDYITMLITNLKAVKYQKIHSGKSIEDNILLELNTLLEDFNYLTQEQQTAVLGNIDYTKNSSSTATRNALRAAITKVKTDETAALKAINDYLTPENYAYADAPGELEKYLTTLCIDIGIGSDYAALDKTATGGKNRKTAVFYDLNNNKPSEGYDLATLTTYFNDMVATRLVTEESMDLVNKAENVEVLNGISFVTILLERFQTVNYKTHSGIPVADKISNLQDLVDRYNALSIDDQAAVLQKVLDGKPYVRSQATTDALAKALDDITFLTISADNMATITGEQFTMLVTAKGTVAEADKEHQVRFYGVISGLAADNIELEPIPGGTPAVVADDTERDYAGAEADDLVLAWGPAGGFPLGNVNYSGDGTTTEFKATIKTAGEYIVTFVFYDITAEKQLNAKKETATITVKEPAEAAGK